MKDEMCYKTVLSPSYKGRTTFRRVYYHPKTGYQIAVVTRFGILMPVDRFMGYWNRYWVSFPAETPNAFTFRVVSLRIAERHIRREYTPSGRLMNRIIVTMANAQEKLPRYYY
jgi:hypothetical protein